MKSRELIFIPDKIISPKITKKKGFIVCSLSIEILLRDAFDLTPHKGRGIQDEQDDIYANFEILERTNTFSKFEGVSYALKTSQKHVLSKRQRI